MNFRLIIAALTMGAASAFALEKPEVTYRVFQFPADKIPHIDGNTDDWAMVPESYVVGTDQLWDDTKKHAAPDPRTLDVRVRVGWVKGLNRLYFLYEATDDYWDFARPDLHNDTFEIVVDGDASGGPLIDKGHKEFWTPERVGAANAAPDDRISADDAHWAIHGVHAQNYHIFTPAVGKDWCMAWGAPTWIKELPWANAAYSFNFKPGEPGKLVLEFWITPFDFAGPEGPQRAVESMLSENKVIGLAWAIIDYDNVDARGNNGFWNLSPKHTMYGNASELCAFRLMPLEPSLLPKLAAQWSWKVVDMDRRLVAFKDLSVGTVTAWKWDFGDGQSSTDQHPIHAYAKPGNYVVILDVTGPDGSSRRSKVWDVQLK
ncbi:MAG TPA: PKD domain-containing protein [Candidatus Didemnitutus sp.]|nr:PKD domain-containing protein [Candidatus Didemnitutus sp.]